MLHHFSVFYEVWSIMSRQEGSIDENRNIYIYVYSVSLSISKKNTDMIHITAINIKMIQSWWKSEWHSHALSLHSIWALWEFWEISGHYYCTLDWKRNTTWTLETERERRGIKLMMNKQVTATKLLRDVTSGRYSDETELKYICDVFLCFYVTNCIWHVINWVHEEFIRDH